MDAQPVELLHELAVAFEDAGDFHALHGRDFVKRREAALAAFAMAVSGQPVTVWTDPFLAELLDKTRSKSSDQRVRVFGPSSHGTRASPNTPRACAPPGGTKQEVIGESAAFGRQHQEAVVSPEIQGVPFEPSDRHRTQERTRPATARGWQR